MLADHYDKMYHEKPEYEDSEHFPPKKAHSFETSTQQSSPSLEIFVAIDFRSDETD